MSPVPSQNPLSKEIAFRGRVMLWPIKSWLHNQNKIFLNTPSADSSDLRCFTANGDTSNYMKIFPYWIFVVSLLPIFFFGCVSYSTHRNTLFDIEIKKAEISNLERQNSILSNQAKNQSNEIELIRKNHDTLEIEYRSIFNDLELLSNRNIELSNQVTRLTEHNQDLVELLESETLEREDRSFKLNNLKARISRLEDLTIKVQDLDALSQTLSEDLEIYRSYWEEKQEEQRISMEQLDTIFQLLTAALKKELQLDQIEMTKNIDYLQIRMYEKMLFESGRTDLKPMGQQILDRIGKVLKGTDTQIEIQGHTDNVPIGPRLSKHFETNWELSTTRASRVVRYLIDRVDLSPSNLSAAGYADSRPIADNSTSKGRSRNRRVDLLLAPSDPPIPLIDTSHAFSSNNINKSLKNKEPETKIK